MSKIKYLFAIFLLVSFFSCSKKSFTDKVDLKPVPSAVVAINEASQLRDYAVKLNSINIDEITSRMDKKAEKEKFKYRILDFKIAYNKSVDLLIELEDVKTKDKAKKQRDLQQKLDELGTIWQYIITTYQI